jgi:hypothetical protein
LRSEHFAEPPICNVPECSEFTGVNQVPKPFIELFIANDALFSVAFVPDANVQHGDFQLPMTGLRQNEIVEILVCGIFNDALRRLTLPPSAVASAF